MNKKTLMKILTAAIVVATIGLTIGIIIAHRSDSRKIDQTVSIMDHFATEWFNHDESLHLDEPFVDAWNNPILVSQTKGHLILETDVYLSFGRVTKIVLEANKGPKHRSKMATVNLSIKGTSVFYD